MDVLIAGPHLVLHEVLSTGQSTIPFLQACYNSVNSRVLNVTTKSARYVQTTVLLVESTLKQAVVNALDNLVFELAHVLDLEHFHHITVRDDGLLGGHIGDGNQLELAELDGFKGKVATEVLVVG